MDTYLQAKKYVDTALIPLIPIAFTDDMKMTVSMGDFIALMAEEIERQFHGRVFLLPPFTYLKDEEDTKRIERLKRWLSTLKENSFKEIILLTSDYVWKNSDKEIDEHLIWLPALPLENMDKQHQIQVIQEQIKQIIPLLMDKWKHIKFD